MNVDITRLTDQLWLALKNREYLAKPESAMAFALRTAIQVIDPQADRLSARIWPVWLKYRDEAFKCENFLDVGCYGGWLYPHYAQHVDGQGRYYGIDVLQSAIDCASTMFGAMHFACRDVMDADLFFNSGAFIWCTQIPDVTNIASRLLQFKPRLVVLESPNLQGKPGGYTDFEEIGGCKVATYWA